MLYVATVHYRSSRWIDVQQRYLRDNLHEPFSVVASLEGIPEEFHDRFSRVVEARGNHEGKLNLLAAEIAADASDDDVILFLDGDAFPVADPMPVVYEGLASTSLVAVRRDENHGDPQPHPCFCAIRVGEWERLHGDWSPGYTWSDARGKPMTDVGGNLLGALRRHGAPWTPLLRTNVRNDHPVWFGVYGNVVYHHGAGFRKPMARLDYAARPPDLRGAGKPVIGPVVSRLNARRARRWQHSVEHRAEELGERWFASLSRDPKFYLQLTQP